MVVGILFGWAVHPGLAWIVMAVWEPFEIFVVHPVVHRLTGFHFGYESWRNSLADIAYNTLGLAIGFFVARPLLPPPFVFP